MSRIGIEFYYKDGTSESYDPVQDFETTDLEYSFWVGGNTYHILKEDVLKLREYPLCDECGHEVYYDGCRRCYMEDELKALRENK